MRQQHLQDDKLTQELNNTSVFNKTMKTNLTNKLNELKIKLHRLTPVESHYFLRIVNQAAEFK